MSKPGDKWIYLLSALLCALLLCGSLALSYSIALDKREEEIPVFAPAAQDKPVSQASVSFAVEDGESGQPLSGVTVVMPDTGSAYVTGADGSTGEITVPVITDQRFYSTLAKPWGEVTALFYREDYAPYALFYLQVEPDAYRQNVKILMFRTQSLSSSRALSIIEGPKRDWVDAMVEKYRPG